VRDVIVYLEDDIVEGQLAWTRDGPCIHVGTNTYSQNVRYRTQSAIGPFTTNGQAREIELPKEVTVQLEPVARTVRAYIAGSTRKEDVYPPSTKNWHKHYAIIGDPAYYFVQETDWDPKLWLTIIDYYDGHILFSHPVNPYETGGLWVDRAHEEWAKSQHHLRKRPGELIDWFEELLSSPPPDWNQLARLTRGAPLKGLKIGQDMRETLEPLVPSYLHEFSRMQIMAFLAWVLLRESGPPKDDPIDLIYRYFPAQIFCYLLTKQLAVIISSDAPPTYARWISIAAENARKANNNPEIFLQTFFDLVNSNTPSISTPEGKLDAEHIVEDLESLRKKADYDKEAWLKLMLYASNSIRLRGDVNYEALGLRQLIYIGAAYRWPHQHLAWWAQLEGNRAFNRRFNVLVVPPRAMKEINRIMSVETVEWSARVANLDLRDSEGQWHVDWNRMLYSADTKTTFDRLRMEYGPRKSVPSIISKRDAAFLDRVQSSFHLLDLLIQSNRSTLGDFGKEEIREKLELFRNDNVLYSLQILDNSTLTIHRRKALESILMVLEGEPNGVLSLVRALLRYTPSSSPFVTQNGSKAYVVARIIKNGPKLADLIEVAKSNDVRVEIRDIQSYRSCVTSLLERLWIEEGMWDEDLSGLLSQSSFKPPS